MTDPVDRLRQLDPATADDPAMRARVRAELLDRIGRSTTAERAATPPVHHEPTGRARLALGLGLAATIALLAGVAARTLATPSGGGVDVESAGSTVEATATGDGDDPVVPGSSNDTDGGTDPTEDPSDDEVAVGQAESATAGPDEPTPGASDGGDAGTDGSTDDPSPDPGTTPETGPEVGAGEQPLIPIRPDAGVDQGAAPGPGFLEQFDGNGGLDRLRVGVYHRNVGAQERGREPEIWGDANADHGGSWTADHDLACGPPGTERTLTSTWEGERADFGVDQLVYTCRGHLMTSMGDVDGYSIVWFGPDQAFSAEAIRTVAWDVNVTDLGGRQWWEVSIVPAGSEFLATVDWLAGTAGIATHHPDAIVIGNGPFGRDVSVVVGGQDRSDRFASVCGDGGLDPEGCASKAIRRSFSVTDNGDGTITVDYGGMFEQTLDGSLPPVFEVYFTDHNYTPDKDGRPQGHTWHWDNLVIG